MKERTKVRKQRRQKTKLGLPDLEHVKSAVLVSLRSPESQRSYRRSIEDFVDWYCSEPRLSFNKTVVTRYRIHLEDRLLAPGTIEQSTCDWQQCDGSPTRPQTQDCSARIWLQVSAA
jgi:hypothetical protein